VFIPQLSSNSSYPHLHLYPFKAAELAKQSDLAKRLDDLPPPIIDAATLGSIRRLKWVLVYHAALSMHMQRLYKPAHDYLLICTHVDMLAAAPDDMILGMVYFFLGVQLSQLERFVEATAAFDSALVSKWGQVESNATLINFSVAKLLQQEGKHVEAIQAFDKSIQLNPQNAHAYFRRAWSHKSLGGLVGFQAAGMSFISSYVSRIAWVACDT